MNDLDKKVKTLADLLPTFSNNLMTGNPPKRFNIGEDFKQVCIAPKQVLLIGSPPSKGKTSLVMGWTFDALYNDPDLRACVLNVEMTPDDLLCREVARQSGVGLTDIQSRLFRNVKDYRESVGKAIETIGTIKDRVAFVDFPFSLEHLAKVVMGHESDLIILDYIQRITPNNKPPKDQRQQNSDCMNLIRKIAQCGKAIIVVSACSRDKGSNGKAYSNLTLGSFRESGELEYGADNCYILHLDDGNGKLQHVKARHSRQEDIYLRFDGDCQRWSKAERVEVEVG